MRAPAWIGGRERCHLDALRSPRALPCPARSAGDGQPVQAHRMREASAVLRCPVHRRTPWRPARLRRRAGPRTGSPGPGGQAGGARRLLRRPRRGRHCVGTRNAGGLRPAEGPRRSAAALAHTAQAAGQPAPRLGGRALRAGPRKGCTSAWTVRTGLRSAARPPGRSGCAGPPTGGSWTNSRGSTRRWRRRWSGWPGGSWRDRREVRRRRDGRVNALIGRREAGGRPAGGRQRRRGRRQ